jgi:hypothetical protein
MEGAVAWLMCHIGRHKWRRMHSPESGGRDAGYLACERCGKEQNEYLPPPASFRAGY